ncbi:MAG: hypothetical protein IJ877_03040 [Candidatus Gastranaerophilales bacterium]|nr:hypothetical protein [Candidatus Gastranaerophilales bacterium]
MKITGINHTFGKNMVAKCIVKNQLKEKHEATLYEYDPWNLDDIDEIESSLNTNSIKPDFYRAGLWSGHTEGRFFALQDDETKDIVASAEITRHYAPFGKYQGDYLLIDELEGNQGYIDSLTPMIGFIANKGFETNSKNIVSAFRTSEMPQLKGYKFKQTDDETWILPKRRFSENINKAEHRNSIEFLA